LTLSVCAHTTSALHTGVIGGPAFSAVVTIWDIACARAPWSAVCRRACSGASTPSIAVLPGLNTPLAV
jgi:hypothetical protein